MKIEEEVCLIDCVNKVKKMFEIQLKHKNISLSINMEKSCRRKIASDPSRLH